MKLVSHKHKKLKGVMPPSKAVILRMFEIQDQAQVDDATWYTVQVNPRLGPWIRKQDPNLWYNHISPNHYKVVDTYDLHERLYTILALKWS